MEALLRSVPKLASSVEASAEAAHRAAVAITTTDLVSKSAALEVSIAPQTTTLAISSSYSQPEPSLLQAASMQDMQE